jgi:sterol desaturase/sphingolipid hydroxylase (fatty acid hydroxylase superfamily)
MNKKVIKALALLIMVAVVIMMVVPVNASYADQMSQLITDADSADVQTGASDTATNVVATVISSVRIIGVCFAVVMLLTVAMKYMSAAPGDKADIKKSAVAYVVGAIVLFAVTGILTIIEQFAVVIK